MAIIISCNEQWKCKLCGWMWNLFHDEDGILFLFSRVTSMREYIYKTCLTIEKHATSISNNKALDFQIITFSLVLEHNYIKPLKLYRNTQHVTISYFSHCENIIFIQLIN